MLAKMGTADATHLFNVCVGSSTLHSKKLASSHCSKRKSEKTTRKNRWTAFISSFTLEATMRDLFPTGQTTINQSMSSSAGTSTSHSDNIS